MNIEILDDIISSTYSPADYPTLLDQRKHWIIDKPLRGMMVLDCSPLFRNTLAKHLALLSAGAELVVGISDTLPHDKAILKLVNDAGVRVVTPTSPVFEVDLVLDCAASFIAWPARLGYVELTKSGTETYIRSRKRVFIADSGRIKRIETCLGTGESYFRAMDQLGYSDWTGRRLVIFGSGKVGTGISTYAHKKGCEVILVTDPPSVSDRLLGIVSDVVDFRDRLSVDSALDGAYAVVSATGVFGAVSNSCTAERLVRSSVLLANMGVEDEFGADIPTDRVLANKQPINFLLDEPTHMKYIDATMALHNEGAVYLATHLAENGVILPPTIIEDRLLDISCRSGLIGGELGLL